MDITQGLSIDGTMFMVPFSSLKRSADFLDKFANRTEDGELKRELIGVYYNFEMEFGDFGDSEEGRKQHDDLWDKLTEPKEFHDVEIPDAAGTYTFRCYISSVSEEYKRIYKDHSEFTGMKCKFIAKKPARK